MIKDLFGIQVIVSVNVINYDTGQYLDYENCNCRKKLVDKLVNHSSAEECTETLEEVKLAKITSMELHSTELHSAKNENKHKYTVCSCHVTYAFESESTLYSCLNVKELLARSRREV